MFCLLRMEMGEWYFLILCFDGGNKLRGCTNCKSMFEMAFSPASSAFWHSLLLLCAYILKMVHSHAFV